MGEANSIVVVAADTLLKQLGDTLTRGLEHRIMTVREEPAFSITPISPSDTSWNTLKKFRQVVVIGQAGDKWVKPALNDSKRTGAYVDDKADVWARGQRVFALVVTPGQASAEVPAQLPALAQRVDSLFQVSALERMMESKPNRALRDTMMLKGGFRMLVPTLYQSEWSDSLLVLRTATTMGGELRRTITVGWRTGVEAGSTTEGLLAWRQATLRRAQKNPGTSKVVGTQRVRTAGGSTGEEVQGIWSVEEGGVPMAGPFMMRVISCPEADRTYLVDASLYAPTRPKYEYMIQLATLVKTFQCGSEASASPGR